MPCQKDGPSHSPQKYGPTVIGAHQLCQVSAEIHIEDLLGYGNFATVSSGPASRESHTVSTSQVVREYAISGEPPSILANLHSCIYDCKPFRRADPFNLTSYGTYFRVLFE